MLLLFVGGGGGGGGGEEGAAITHFEKWVKQYREYAKY